MTTAIPLSLAFQVGARTLFKVKRRLVRVALSLDDVLAARATTLPPLDATADGYTVTSLPAQLEAPTVAASGGMIAFVRQRYTRYHADLSIGFDAWWASLSSNARSGLKRKEKRIGAADIIAYRTPDELERFHVVAREIALKTYQEKLMGAGLPDTPDFVSRMLQLAAGDAVRAWTLAIDGAPAAYLYCPIRDDTAIYEYVGHDPGFSDLSPGAVLQLQAMRDLFGEGRYAHFDFTEGEGQHKRTMATAGVACVDLLLLRPTLVNRATVAALGAFDRSVALAKAGVHRLELHDVARRLRRG